MAREVVKRLRERGRRVRDRMREKEAVRVLVPDDDVPHVGMRGVGWIVNEGTDFDWDRVLYLEEPQPKLERLWRTGKVACFEAPPDGGDTETEDEDGDLVLSDYGRIFLIRDAPAQDLVNEMASHEIIVDWEKKYTHEWSWFLFNQLGDAEYPHEGPLEERLPPIPQWWWDLPL